MQTLLLSFGMGRKRVEDSIFLEYFCIFRVQLLLSPVVCTCPWITSRVSIVKGSFIFNLIWRHFFGGHLSCFLTKMLFLHSSRLELLSKETYLRRFIDHYLVNSHFLRCNFNVIPRGLIDR